jgi:peptide deformylase
MFRMFVCLNKKCLIPQQWFGYKQELNDYDCVINPELIETSTLEEYAYEQCPSIAGYRMKVKRPVFGRFKWRDENFKEKD